MYQYYLSFGVGVLASLVSAVAGAGSGLLSLPYLILLGLPPKVAIATTKLSGVGLALGTIEKFRKTQHVRWEFIVPFILITVLAGVTGSLILIKIDADVVQTIVGIAVLVVVPCLFLGRLGAKRQDTSRSKRTTGYLIKYGIESLQAAFSSGIGILTSFVYMHNFGMSAIETSATKRIPGLFKDVVVLPIFVIADLIDWGHGTAMLLGSSVGGYLGAHIAIARGNKFVRIALAVVALIMALKLLL